ncbi:hypothetical protein FB451DRAFT_1267428 [Mycena latifolia]|nr:hypothetical protein FB451DRAFT_1267428 [Mycena latifolia]
MEPSCEPGHVFRKQPHCTFETLPPEISAEIFLSCVSLPVTLPPAADEVLLVLAQVCHSWRELALNIPALWGNIIIPFDWRGHNLSRITEITAQWLSRSGAIHPLSITAGYTTPASCIVVIDDGFVNPMHTDTDALAAFMALVQSYAHRLKHYDLGLPFPALRQMLHLPSGSFPCLETLVLRPCLDMHELHALDAESRARRWDWPSTSGVFDASSRLRSVAYRPACISEKDLADIDGADMMRPPDDAPVFVHSISLPWAQLCYISFPMAEITPATWCTIFCQCLNLECCEISITQPEPDFEAAKAFPVQMGRLVSLCVMAEDGTAAELIDYLAAPMLKEFSVACRRFAASTLMDFQARSGFTLERLLLDANVIATDDIEMLFQNFPDLTTVCLLDMCTEDFPASLWDRVANSELLPALAELRIQPLPSQISMLVDMVERNWGAATTSGSPGLKVALCDVEEEDWPAVEEELRRLQRYEAAGRKVEVVSLTTGGGILGPTTYQIFPSSSLSKGY